MKKYALPLICICIMTFSLISCAELPACESKPYYPENNIFLGMYHGLALPFSVIGKVLGFKIGIYSADNSHFSYWFGFLLGIVAYARIFILLGKSSKE